MEWRRCSGTLGAAVQRSGQRGRATEREVAKKKDGERRTKAIRSKIYLFRPSTTGLTFALSRWFKGDNVRDLLASTIRVSFSSH